MDIKIKRAYDAPTSEDGRRILVDRLWPRGISKDNAQIVYWPKELAPSTELRRWYNHEPGKWDEFRTRYFAELDAQPEGVGEVINFVDAGTVAFVYSSKEARYNNAVALKEYVEDRRS